MELLAGPHETFSVPKIFLEFPYEIITDFLGLSIQFNGEIVKLKREK